MSKIKKKCPILKDECQEEFCEWFVPLIGKHPQTGKDINESKCTFAWLPILLIEGTMKTNQVAAAIEDFRNSTAPHLNVLPAVIMRVLTNNNNSNNVKELPV